MKKIIFAVFAVLMLCSCASNNTEGLVRTENEKVSDVTTNAEGGTDYYAIDNKGFGWGFKKNEGAKPDIPKETVDMLSKYDAYYMDQRENKVLYLTFDEGYENGYTGQILDTLKKCDVPAAFFVTGSYFDREQELIKRMVDEGHIVGNHTENHPNMHKLQDAEKMKEELKLLDDKFYAQFGERMKYMRPPEGEYSERVLAAAKDAGYKTMFWSFAYKDWIKDANMGADYAFNSVTPYLHSGAIILLHAVSRDNADALEDIITYAREHGYEFKSLDDL